MENQNNPANATQKSNEMEDQSKYGKLYNLIDAFVDTVNLAQNRKNAIKYGVRAIGEILSEFPHEDDLNNESHQMEPQQINAVGGNVQNKPGSGNVQPKAPGRG
jgi:hypothetical protein